MIKSNTFNFYPGIELGQNISLKELRKHYNVVFLCFGAQESKRLDCVGSFPVTIEGKNIFQANKFVGWYNGTPKYADSKLYSDDIIKEALLIGHGNVSLDIARIILKRSMDIKIPNVSDIFEREMGFANIQEIKIVGRRGPKDVNSFYQIRFHLQLESLEICSKCLILTGNMIQI